MIKFNQKINSENLKGKIYVSSDLHFFHANVIKFCPDTRPWSTVEEMNEGLISHWNEVVCEDDIVLHLGDFSFGNADQTRAILDRLNGNIVHLYGNHSKALRNSLNVEGFDYLEFTYNKTHITCNHYAQRVWNRSHYGSLCLYGHSHGSLEGVGRSMDVGWDAHGRLLTLDEVVATLKQKEIYCEDGH